MAAKLTWKTEPGTEARVMYADNTPVATITPTLTQGHNSFTARWDGNIYIGSYGRLSFAKKEVEREFRAAEQLY